jgi:DNA-binding transcriptional MerR regulator
MEREIDADEPAIGATQASSRSHLRIGGLARELGINPKTIRYYEAIGLLPVPQRTASGYRLYGAADRDRLRFIAKAKTIGLTLQEIGEILALRDAGTESRRYAQMLIDRKLTAVDEELRRLTRVSGDLRALRAKTMAAEGASLPICDIIERYVDSRPAHDRSSPG